MFDIMMLTSYGYDTRIMSRVEIGHEFVLIFDKSGYLTFVSA